MVSRASEQSHEVFLVVCIHALCILGLHNRERMHLRPVSAKGDCKSAEPTDWRKMVQPKKELPRHLILRHIHGSRFWIAEIQSPESRARIDCAPDLMTLNLSGGGWARSPPEEGFPDLLSDPSQTRSVYHVA